MECTKKGASGNKIIKVKVCPAVPAAGAAMAKAGVFSTEQLLPRRNRSLDLTGVANQLKGKTVLVTGAAGSIGSEICRQALSLGCDRLLALYIH